MILDETLLRDASAQIEAAFSQAALQDLQIDDTRERAALWCRTGPHLRPNPGLVAAPSTGFQTLAALARLGA
jgi:hypothetical protein